MADHRTATGTSGAPPAPLSVAGLVLAGGRSSRMCRDKAFLEVGGKTLLIRQVAALEHAGIPSSEVFVSLRKDQEPPSDPELTVVYDHVEGLGPLAGIAAAMQLAPNHHLLVLAVDMPAVTPGHLRRLLSACRRGVGATFRSGAVREPLCAVYPPDCLSAALGRLRGARRAPSALVAELVKGGRMHELPLRDNGARSLKSWNRPEDVSSDTAWDRTVPVTPSSP